MRRGPCVLLVEDVASTARATASMLCEGGVIEEVAIAADAGTALERVEAGGIDLVVVDLGLRGDQGLDLLRALRSSSREHAMPIIVLSSTSDPDLVRRTYRLGANCFVRKPRRVVELAPAVRAIEQFWGRHNNARPDDADRSLFQLPMAATADSVREARATVRLLVEGWGMAALASTAEVCTSELATNAVLHSRSPLLLVVAMVPSGVRIEVEDESPGTLEKGSLDGPGETGRGLAIVDALSECWGVDQHRAGKTVWFELRVADRAGAARGPGPGPRPEALARGRRPARAPEPGAESRPEPRT